jgi:formylmethanofuran dehydrogenase subunit E
MLKGYQVIPNEDLFKVRAVRLEVPLAEILSKPGRKSECVQCGEEIINGREVSRDGMTLCRACAGDGYFQVLEEAGAVAAG